MLRRLGLLHFRRINFVEVALCSPAVALLTGGVNELVEYLHVESIEGSLLSSVRGA